MPARLEACALCCRGGVRYARTPRRAGSAQESPRCASIALAAASGAAMVGLMHSHPLCILPLCLCIFAAVPAHAGDIAACARIADDRARLACYDAIAGPLPSTAAA